MKMTAMMVGLLGLVAAGQASAQSFEAQAAEGINRMSVEIGQARGGWTLRPVAARAAVTPSKGFDSSFKCGSHPTLLIALNADGTVTINGDHLVPDGADHPYKGIQYNCSFVDANTFKIRTFGKFGSTDIDAYLTLTIVDGGRTLSVSKNDKTSLNGRRIGEDESYACSRSFWRHW